MEMRNYKMILFNKESTGDDIKKDRHSLNINYRISTKANIIDNGYLPQRLCFFLTFEHDSFDPCPIGAELPIIHYQD